MFKHRLLVVCALVATTCSAWALPPGVSLEGRVVLFDSTAQPAPASRLQTTAAQPASFSRVLSAQEAAVPYALMVAGPPPSADGWRITINGSPFEQSPEVSDEGLWYSIPEEKLVEGANTVEVSGGAATTVAPEGLLSFSIDPAEQEYFKFFVAPMASPPTIEPSQRDYDVQHMDIAITMDPASATIPSAAPAVVTITAKSLIAGLTQCILDFNDNSGQMVIDAVDSGPSTPGLVYDWRIATEKLWIDLPGPVAQGADFTVRVTYHGTPVAGKGYRRGVHNSTVPNVYTYNQPYDARTWLPCKDIPEDRFLLDVHATVPNTVYSGYPLFVVSNGTLTSVEPSGSNNIYHWHETYPIVTQYVSLNCSNYRPASGVYTGLSGTASMPVTHRLFPESYATESPELPRTIEVMGYYASQFGEFPFINEKYETASWMASGGMEHQTCTSLPPNEMGATPYHRRNIHELFHMWFGDAIGVETFQHVWISEGWASYAEALWKEHHFGITDFKTRMSEYKSSSSDGFAILDATKADTFGVSPHYGVEYCKAAWVVHMLRRVMGDTAFFQGAKNFATDPSLQYKSVVTDDLQGHMEAVYGADLSWFFDEWLLQTTRPSYQWLWATHTSGSDTWVDLGVTQVQSGTSYTMPIDFRITFSDSSTKEITVLNNQLSQNFSVNVGSKTPTGVTFDWDSWILCNATNVSASTPAAPTLQSVKGNGVAGTATITWTPSATPLILGYRLYQSPDGLNGWTLVQNEIILGSSATSAVVSGLTYGTTVYYRVTAVGTAEGTWGDVYGTRIGASTGTVLIVDAFDRLTLENSDGNHTFVRFHGQALAARPNAFDTCANEALGVSVDLASYPVVDWLCADESVADETFSSSEQTRVKAYLEGGGGLFVTGNEIGWDLGRSGTSSVDDLAFYNNYLKATFDSASGGDDSNDYTVYGPGAPSCFGSEAFGFGTTGSGAPYQPSYPDVLYTVTAGGVANLMYDATKIAGVQYKGTFGTSGTEGRLVYLGFAFETINTAAERNAAMDYVLDYFDVSAPVTVSRFECE